MHVPFWIRFPSSPAGFPCHCNEKPRVLNENSGQQGGRRETNPAHPLTWGDRALEGGVTNFVTTFLPSSQPLKTHKPATTVG